MALNYQIALTNVTFEDNYNDVIRFTSREEQESYFNVASLFANAPEVNFNVDSLIRTNLVYTDRSTTDISKLMNYNYCIVKDNNVGHERKYYYYFVQSVKFNNFRQIYLDVELDVVNTYFLDLYIDDCLIERAHLNRFKEVSPTEVEFNFGKDSLFYEREPINPTAKYLTKRKKLNFIYDTEDPFGDFNKLLNNNYTEGNSILWVYAFLSVKDDGYKTGKFGGGTEVIKGKTAQIFGYGAGDYKYLQPYICICYPITNTYALTIKKDNISDLFYIDGDGFNKFIDNNGGYANVLSMKLSTLAPFEVGKYPLNKEHGGYKFENDRLQLLTRIPDYHNLLLLPCEDGSNQGIMILAYQDFTGKLRGYSLSEIKTKFTKEEIKSSRNLNFNPKLKCFDYFNIALTNGVNRKEYDFTKICPNGENIDYEYTEVICPDITKQYIRINPNKDSIYSPEVANNFDGLVTSIDYSLLYSKSNLDIFLANNKNFFLQKVTGYVPSVFSEVADASKLLIHTKGIAESRGHSLASGTSLISGAVNIASNIVNDCLSYDNLKSSPEQLAGANGNGALNVAVNNAGLYLDYYDTTDNEKHMFDDYTHLYGFTYNRIDSINNVIDIRKNFNYVKAQVEIIKSNKNISNEVKTIIKKIFAKGVTFWSVTDSIFNHNVPNYERWLDR